MEQRRIKSKQANQTQPRLRSLARWHALGLAMAILAAAALGYWLVAATSSEVVATAATYVGKQTCAECHREQAEAFQNSHHDLAMNPATPATVLAQFDGSTLEHYGVTSRMYMDGTRYMVQTEGPDGTIQDFEVKYVFGVSPLQQYLVELQPSPTDRQPHSSDRQTPLGRFQVLRESWDTVNKRWFYLMPPDVDSRLEPGDPLHWTGLYQSWNTFCASCHSTYLQKNFDAAKATFKTTFAEIDVSCEACHGPGSNHVAWARSPWAAWRSPPQHGLNQLKNNDPIKQIETCAPCHSRRAELHLSWTPGDPLDRHFSLQLIEFPIYERDGQIRDENYEYGSFIQSKMHAAGIRCTDCHDPHSLRLKHPANQLCTNCHQHPAAKYDTADHHHHAPGTPGSYCVDCHMPETIYMEVDPRRDHSLRAPRPDLSVMFGTPNACTGCHLNPSKLPEDQRPELRQYLDWRIAAERGNAVVAAELRRTDEAMAAAFNRWYGEEPHAARTEYYHDLAAVLSTREGKSEVAGPLVRNLAVPTMIRASALLNLARESDEESLRLARSALRSGDSHLIRGAIPRIEGELQRRQDDIDSSYVELLTEVAELLNHESLVVRIEATRTLIGLPRPIRERSRLPAFSQRWSAAIKEWRQVLAGQGDWPQNHVLLGDIFADEGRFEEAIQAYETAIRIGPTWVGARTNLASLLDDRLAEKSNRLQVDRNLSAADRERLLADAERLQQRITELRESEYQLLATEIARSGQEPSAGGLHYRFAMSCYLRGEKDKCEHHLLKSHRLQPDDPAPLLGLIAYYRDTDQLNRAIEFAEKLAALDPRDRRYAQILAGLRSHRPPQD